MEEEISTIEKSLEQEIRAEKQIDLREKLQLKQHDLENIIEYKTKGAIIRGKIKWYKDGEKNTKCFLRLEKRHYNRKNITNLKFLIKK